jgi:hypothetical protein
VNHKPKVLFFSTGDSTRSQMAEGFLRAFAGDGLVAASTAVDSVEPDPLTAEVMKEVGVFQRTFQLCSDGVRRVERKVSGMAIYAKHPKLGPRRPRAGNRIAGAETRRLPPGT